jgi:hypothetical protein
MRDSSTACCELGPSNWAPMIRIIKRRCRPPPSRSSPCCATAKWLLLLSRRCTKTRRSTSPMTSPLGCERFHWSVQSPLPTQSHWTMSLFSHPASPMRNRTSRACRCQTGLFNHGSGRCKKNRDFPGFESRFGRDPGIRGIGNPDRFGRDPGIREIGNPDFKLAGIGKINPDARASSPAAGGRGFRGLELAAQIGLVSAALTLKFTIASAPRVSPEAPAEAWGPGAPA